MNNVPFHSRGVEVKRPAFVFGFLGADESGFAAGLIVLRFERIKQ